MNAILGLIVTVAMVFGGYLLAGGHMEIIMHALPFEGMMIGGAAIGALLAANDFNTVKHTMGDVVAAWTSWILRRTCAQHATSCTVATPSSAGSYSLLKPA